jgi:hypothetical protein
MSYSDLIDRLLLREGLLASLIPTDVADSELVRRVREVDLAAIAGHHEIADWKSFSLVRGGLFYLLDALAEAHTIFQEAKGDLGSYWHGMVHRREGDFDNARYWFRRAGELPIFTEIHRAAANHSELMARQSNWDPYLFVGQCEQARFGDDGSLWELMALQRVEFDSLFDYSWRQSVSAWKHCS